MKKTLWGLAFFLGTSLALAEPIHQEIQAFIQQYFPSEQVTEYKFMPQKEYERYKIELTNEVEITFNPAFKPTEIESEYLGVPLEALPNRVADYLTTNYPGDKVKEWDTERSRQEVKLMNGQKLYFDLEGNLL